MKDRIKAIRKKCGETQQSFADQLNISKSTVEAYEYGRVGVPPRTISDICRIYNVSETWLRTGQGEMFVQQSRDEQIASFIGRIQACEDETFKKRFISMLSTLDASDWETLEKMALALAQKEKD